MRRKDKIGSDSEILLREAPVCRLAFSAAGPGESEAGPGEPASGGFPYVVPLHFAWDGAHLYVHCAPEGEKLRRLARDERVCVEIDELGAVVPASSPCGFSTRFRSLIALGRAQLVADPAEKQQALTALAVKYGGAEFAGWKFESRQLDGVAVLRIRLEEVSVKQSGMQ